MLTNPPRAVPAVEPFVETGTRWPQRHSPVRHWRIAGLLLLTCVLIACAAPPPAPTPVVSAPPPPVHIRVGPDPMPYARAIEAIALDLAGQLREHGAGPGERSRLMVIDPFVDAQTGYGTGSTTRAQKDLGEHLSQASPGLTAEPMGASNLPRADYVLTGALSFDIKGNDSALRHYRILVSLTHARTGALVAKAAAWLSDRSLDMAPLAPYSESPIFHTDRHTESLVNNLRLPAGQTADPGYLQQLKASALQADAQRAYASGDYPLALAGFQQAEALPEGKSMKTYSALYVTQRKLGNAGMAEKAFQQMLEVALDANRLSLRFLFRVNSTEFVTEDALAEQYRSWLRLMAHEFVKRNLCHEVIGHSSRTGTDAYNDALSLRRAEAIRQQLRSAQPASASLTRAVGRGFRENIVGSGSDDARDAVDRRVEFRTVPCPLSR